MKNIISITIAILMVAFLPNTISAQSGMDQFEVKVDGLGCPFCAYGLEKKFKEFKGIKDVKIEIETGVMNFNYPTDKMLTMVQVEEKVDAAGYTPVHVKVDRADGSHEETTPVVMAEVDEANLIEKSFSVAGNCGMCQARIEKTAKSVKGVTAASWDKKSKQVTVSFDGNMTSMEAIQEAIAKSGHDTDGAKADAKVYDELPGCCQYDREQ